MDIYNKEDFELVEVDDKKKMQTKKEGRVIFEVGKDIPDEYCWNNLNLMNYAAFHGVLIGQQTIRNDFKKLFGFEVIPH